MKSEKIAMLSLEIEKLNKIIEEKERKFSQLQRNIQKLVSPNKKSVNYIG